MARARNLKPALFKNEILGVADPLLTLLFEGLWLLADREGRLEDRPMRIKAEVFPYRDALDVDGMINWLQAEGFLLRYQVEGKRFIEVLNFSKHQNPHKNEPASEIPCVSKGCSSTEKFGTCPEEIGSAPADSLSLDSLNLIPDSNTPQPPKGERRASPPAKGQGDAERKPSMFDQFWRLYPRKTSKLAAEKAWAKLKPDQALFEMIIASLSRHCASRDWLKDDGQFIPHPATWLNQKRWNDEVRPAGNVHHLPTSRHHGFADRDYTAGLKQREDGSYAL